MKDAIQKAIEGGWLPLTVSEWTDECVLKQVDFETWAIEEPMHDIITGNPLKPLVHKFEIYKVLLDPLFWQALGKNFHTKWMRKDGCGADNPDFNVENKEDWKPTWLYQWHRFTDHRAEGKNADEFFDNLSLRKR